MTPPVIVNPLEELAKTEDLIYQHNTYGRERTPKRKPARQIHPAGKLITKHQVGIFEQVKTALTRELSIPEAMITKDATWNDLHLDSLGIVTAFMVIGEEIGLDIPETDTQRLEKETINALVCYIEKNQSSLEPIPNLSRAVT